MDDTRGLCNKYEIIRIDGKEGRENCQYFVLDLCHDPYAKPALEAYIAALPESFALLKKDLTKLLKGFKFDPKTEKVKRQKK